MPLDTGACMIQGCIEMAGGKGFRSKSILWVILARRGLPNARQWGAGSGDLARAWANHPTRAFCFESPEKPQLVH